MKQFIFCGVLVITLSSLLFTACKKETNPPIPVEEELITTLKLNVTATGFSKSFIYKVENGFGGGDSGTVVIDTLALAPNTTYTVKVEVLNEKENPAEDITTEILEENEEHLFLYNALPATGAGSITFSNGSKDDQGAPFNQTIDFTTGAAGSGSLTVHLMHLPSDKNGTTPAAAGGSTDLEAVFPVKLQ